MSRIDIGLGRHGPFHGVRLAGRPDNPTLRMEVPGACLLCMTAEGAGAFADAIIAALEDAGLRENRHTEASEIAAALLGGTLGVVEHGLATPAFEVGSEVMPASDTAAKMLTVCPGDRGIVEKVGGGQDRCLVDGLAEQPDPARGAFPSGHIGSLCSGRFSRRFSPTEATGCQTPN